MRQRPNFYILVWIAFLLGLIACGIFGFYRIQLSGLEEARAIAWGLLIPGYVFFVPSAGATLVNSIYTVFRVPQFKPIMKRAVCLSLLLCIPALLFIIFGSLAKWDQFYNIYLFTHWTSRIGWNGILVVGLVLALIIELIVVLREETMPRWAPLVAGITALAAVVTVHTNLGAIFGAVTAKPLWSSHLLPIQFVVSAMLAGTVLTVLFISISYLVRRGSIPGKVKELFSRDYGFIAIVLIIINWVLIAAKWIPLAFNPEEFQHLKVLLAGSLSPTFWGLEVVLGTIIPLIILFYRRTRQSMGWLLVASALITVGLFVGKYDLIIGGQSMGGLFPAAFLPYFPSGAEFLFLAGGIGVLLLLYTLAELLLPLEPGERPVWFIFGKRGALLK